MNEPAATMLAKPKMQGVRERGPAATATMRKYGAGVALILLIIFSSLQSDRFLQVDNVLNVLRQISIVGVLALGMTFVIITAGIDLSVGSMLSVVVVYTADTVQTRGVFLGVIMALSLGCLLGLVNGLGVAIGRIQPFVMTLGMLAFAKGIALIFTEGQPVAITNDAFLAFGNGRTLGIPNPAIVFLVLLAVCMFVLRGTVFGRSVYAVGANEEAARLSGIPVRRVKCAVYVISGLMVGIAGILYASQLGVGTPVAGDGKELDAIAATVVGGTSLFGGVGTAGGTFVGAAILGVLSNILNLSGVSPYVQYLFRGGLIVAAVLLQRREGRGR
ncbi:ABC transporter permease [Phycicoccus sp. Root101]|uniref:ABC transporter permease n=1 Tax=Phycicoccus sp. Root101 TaxID=1736421 RepID=UPI0009E88696|nr:ABC transporter permease [Phycicoccus sp. Root101]